MESPSAQCHDVDLRAVAVRPTRGSEEHRRWDRLVAAHHYLPFHGLFGKGLRHVATLGSTWLALVGWQAGAFKLTARDDWIGWSAEQQFRRLHLIANNSRFVVLPHGRVANLASRVLGLSLRRLSRDMLEAHGHPVLLAETFVDPARFSGAAAAQLVRVPGRGAGVPPCAGPALRAQHRARARRRPVDPPAKREPRAGRHGRQGCPRRIEADRRAAPWHETVGKEHGRIERRRCAAVDLTGPDWDGYADLHARRQAVRIEREREVVKTGATSVEVTYCLTSLGTERAGPEQLLALVRNHWHIENRLHHVRDFTYDEDRCRAYVRNLPRHLACLTNAAISIVRCRGEFKYLPEANRHYAARAQDALDAILNPPTG